MFGAIREYKLQLGTDQYLYRRIRDEFVPKIASLPDLVSYTVARVGENGLITTSIFESEVGAQQSVKLAGDWVKSELQTFVIGTPRITTGTVAIRHVNENETTRWGVMRRFSYMAGSAPTITARVREGLIPTLNAIPGLATFGLLFANGSYLVGTSLSTFSDRAAAEESNKRSLVWIKENVGDLLTTPPEIMFGEITLRHTRTTIAAG
jgi:hypothetical protein